MLQAPVWLLPAKSINSIEKTKPIQARVILGKTIPKKNKKILTVLSWKNILTETNFLTPNFIPYFLLAYWRDDY